MAQVVRDQESHSGKLRALVRQHPVLVAAAGLFVMALVFSVVFGVGAAGGDDMLIERAGSFEQADNHEGADKGSVQKDSPEMIVVDVAGAVASPGIVRLPDGSRVDDAIAAAGGLRDDADTSSLNRAAKVADGVKVYVPAVGEASPVGDASTDAGVASVDAGTGLVSINTATIDELQTLPGVGPSTAQAIVEDREQNGAFASVEDLMRVSGIGEKKFAKLKNSICL